MEGHIYHLHPSAHLVLGSHMLEVRESIAEGKPSLEIHLPGHRRQRGPGGGDAGRNNEQESAATTFMVPFR